MCATVVVVVCNLGPMLLDCFDMGWIQIRKEVIHMVWIDLQRVYDFFIFVIARTFLIKDSML